MRSTPVMKTIIVGLALVFLCRPAPCSSLEGAVKGLSVDKISSRRELEAALEVLSSYVQVGGTPETPGFAMQKMVLEKAGRCTGKIVTLQHASAGALTQERARDLFNANRGIIKRLLVRSTEFIEDLQENRLDEMEDTAAFFASSAWQEPHYLISLASYWLSWNGYYASLLYSVDDALRKDLLEQAIEGFSRSVIDFKEQEIVVRSLFGRSLCYKEMQAFEKATVDINAVLGKIGRDNELYVRCRYEKALISFLAGKYEAVMTQLQEIAEDVDVRAIPRVMQKGLSALRVKTRLALLEQHEARYGAAETEKYLSALKELRELVRQSPDQAGELYRFVRDHGDIFIGRPFGELGPVGTLAVADACFKAGQYEKAALRYSYVCTAQNHLVRKRMDDIYFRLAFSHCRNEAWTKALAAFTTLFSSYPSSTFIGKAACLDYVAAARRYTEDPVQETYLRYIKAIKRYVKHCPDPEDASEAHFQLARYYQDRGNHKKALAEYALVGNDSPNYTEAVYRLLKEQIGDMERLARKGLRKTKKSRALYRQAVAKLNELQKLIKAHENGPYKTGLEAHAVLLQSRLHAFGPEGGFAKALSVLNGFEGRFTSVKDHRDLCRYAVSVRMECYQKLNRMQDAEKEVHRLLADTHANWALLNECGSGFYHIAKESLQKSETELAILIYGKLLPVALSKSVYGRYADAIMLRLADLYMINGQPDKALPLYTRLLETDPASADALYNIAQLYEEQQSWEDALATWRAFAKGLESGSHYWFDARCGTVRALGKLGMINNACNIITMTKVLHPELRDPEFKARFLMMEEELCEGEGKEPAGSNQ